MLNVSSVIAVSILRVDDSSRIDNQPMSLSSRGVRNCCTVERLNMDKLAMNTFGIDPGNQHCAAFIYYADSQFIIVAPHAS